jgi:hypothetical protein
MKQPRQAENVLCDVKRCGACGCTSKVIAGKPRVLAYWRVRECLRCGHQWDTFESRLDPDDIPAAMLARLKATDFVKI